MLVCSIIVLHLLNQSSQHGWDSATTDTDVWYHRTRMAAHSVYTCTYMHTCTETIIIIQCHMWYVHVHITIPVRDSRLLLTYSDSILICSFIHSFIHGDCDSAIDRTLGNVACQIHWQDRKKTGSIAINVPRKWDTRRRSERLSGKNYV